MLQHLRTKLPTMSSTICLAACGLIGIYAGTANAGAFQVWEQNASGTGDYHAGGAAEAADASTNFYNPAGLTKIKRPEIATDVTYIPVDPSFNGTVDNIHTKGWIHGDTENIVPSLHASYPISNKVSAGISLTTPFGLATEYPKSDPIDAVATRTQLKTININPNIALQLTHKLSIGAGLQAEYGEADFDEVALHMVNETNHLSGWGYGYDVGALYDISDDTRVGINYRSAITIDADGTSKSGNAGFLGGPSSAHVSTELPLPATTTLSLYHKMNSHWSVMGSVYYTQWSRLQAITLNNIALPAATQGIYPNYITNIYDYKNTFNFSLGSHYQFNKIFTLKVGVGYDQTPTNDKYRDVRLPDTNHTALAVGGHIQANKHTAFDLGYVHFFTKEVSIDNNGAIPSSPWGIKTVGKAKTNVNVFGIQATYIF